MRAVSNDANTSFQLLSLICLMANQSLVLYRSDRAKGNEDVMEVGCLRKMLSKPYKILTLSWTGQSLRETSVQRSTKCIISRSRFQEDNRAQVLESLSCLAILKYFNCNQLRPPSLPTLYFPSITLLFGQVVKEQAQIFFCVMLRGSWVYFK